MKSWPFGAAGAAMLVIAVALLTTASMRGTEKAFVAGTVHVVKVSEPPLGTDYGRCEMQVQVDALGHPGQTVVIRDPRVPVNKWPDVGETLPALVSVADARRIKIQWERVGTYHERYEEAFAEPDYVPFDTTDEFPAVVESPADLSHEDFSYDLLAEPVIPLPRRQPSPTRADTHPVAVLEGELITADAAAARSALFAENVDVLDFSGSRDALPDDREPAAAVSPAGPAETFLATQPNARPASAGSIHGVGITVLVTDLERSVRFYRDMLGFYEIDGGPDTVILASGDTRVVLVTSTESAPVSRRMVHLNLEVGDVDAVYQELKVRGIRFTYPPRVVNRGERLELVAAAFKDPDGHGIAVTQWKARTT